MRIRALILALCLSMSGFAFADARSDAEAAMQEGAARYKKKKYTDAIASYEKALEAFPEAPGPYREIAKCYTALNQPAEAIDSFTEYLNRRPDAPEREDIEARFTKLRGQLPKNGKALLSVDSDPEGSMVFVLDKSGKAYGIGVSPIEEHPVELDIVKVKVVRAYFEPEEKPVSLKANTSFEVSVVLSTARKRDEVVAAPPVSEPPRGYLFLGAAAASGIGAGTVGFLFLQARQDFALVPATDPDVEAKQRAQRRLAIISDGLTGAALLTGGVGAYLFLKHHKFAKESEKTSALIPTLNGVALLGHF